MRLDGTIQPDLSVIDWREMRESTPRNLRRPTPQTLEGQVALAAALLATHLLYEGDVKVILKRRLRCSTWACGRYLARARARLYARSLAEQKRRLDAAAAPPAGATRGVAGEISDQARSGATVAIRERSKRPPSWPSSGRAGLGLPRPLHPGQGRLARRRVAPPAE